MLSFCIKLKSLKHDNSVTRCIDKKYPKSKHGSFYFKVKFFKLAPSCRIFWATFVKKIIKRCPIWSHFRYMVIFIDILFIVHVHYVTRDIWILPSPSSRSCDSKGLLGQLGVQGVPVHPVCKAQLQASSFPRTVSA